MDPWQRFGYGVNSGENGAMESTVGDIGLDRRLHRKKRLERILETRQVHNGRKVTW